jgi:hypothetical protein
MVNEGLQKMKNVQQQQVLFCHTRCGELHTRPASSSICSTKFCLAAAATQSFTPLVLMILPITHEGFTPTCINNTVMI